MFLSDYVPLHASTDMYFPPQQQSAQDVMHCVVWTKKDEELWGRGACWKILTSRWSNNLMPQHAAQPMAYGHASAWRGSTFAQLRLFGSTSAQVGPPRWPRRVATTCQHQKQTTKIYYRPKGLVGDELLLSSHQKYGLHHFADKSNYLDFECKEKDLVKWLDLNERLRSIKLVLARFRRSVCDWGDSSELFLIAGKKSNEARWKTAVILSTPLQVKFNGFRYSKGINYKLSLMNPGLHLCENEALRNRAAAVMIHVQLHTRCLTLDSVCWKEQQLCK